MRRARARAAAARRPASLVPSAPSIPRGRSTRAEIARPPSTPRAEILASRPVRPRRRRGRGRGRAAACSRRRLLSPPSALAAACSRRRLLSPARTIRAGRNRSASRRSRRQGGRVDAAGAGARFARPVRSAQRGRPSPDDIVSLRSTDGPRSLRPAVAPPRARRGSPPTDRAIDAPARLRAWMPSIPLASAFSAVAAVEVDGWTNPAAGASASAIHKVRAIVTAGCRQLDKNPEGDRLAAVKSSRPIATTSTCDYTSRPVRHVCDV